MRAELEASGLTLTDGLPAGAQQLASLRHDGEPLTAEAHASCPGRCAYFRSYDLASPVHYCADPGGHGHTSMWESPAAGSRAGLGGPGIPSPGGLPAESEADRQAASPARRLVIQGNRAWTAAADVRWRWLAGQLFGRRTAPREAAPFIARQLLTMPGPLRSGLDVAHSSIQGSEITGRDGAGWLELCDTAAAGRLPLLMLAPVVIAYERALTEGTGRDTWRRERYTTCSFDDAGRYFTFLASVGYQLSAIERSVAEATPYTGDAPAGETLLVRLAGEDDADTEDVRTDVPQDVPPGQDVTADTGTATGPEQAVA